MTERILLFSGGLDSLALWSVLETPVRPVYVRIGHKYQQYEIEACAALCEAVSGLRVAAVDGPMIGHTENQRDGHIPYRNLNLISTVAAIYNPTDIYIGGLVGETSRDKSEKFRRRAQGVLRASEGGSIRVHYPCKKWGWTKSRLVANALYQNPEILDALKITRSCYSIDTVPCGRCMACFRRWVAMGLNGIEEEYRLEPWVGQQVDLRYLWQFPFREWAGIARNNYDAWKAIRKIEGK